MINTYDSSLGKQLSPIIGERGREEIGEGGKVEPTDVPTHSKEGEAGNSLNPNITIGLKT